jgi:hypothetical protein
MYTTVVPTDAHKYTEISSYTQWPPTCFSQSCGRRQGGKIQRMGPLHFTSWPHGLLKHGVYKLISMYLCTFVGATIVYIQLMHRLWII